MLRKDTMAILFVAFAVGGTVSSGWFASANEDGSCERGAPHEDSTYTTNFELVRKPRRRECRAQTRTRLIRLCRQPLKHVVSRPRKETNLNFEVTRAPQGRERQAWTKMGSFIREYTPFGRTIEAVEEAMRPTTGSNRSRPES